ncbi:Peroxyureidoacrylate/ureidoacrylate amidohydrolase RutB [Mycobacterium basiliense]|uniref:Peroxyureidoacrylate/ureidoacrylate amidohydrolase RutB n=1 Tax=Mycobacterium basiliense TaxID=2094119 RepID=A0A3S4BEU3_9MYCO|nr:isochorismatase family cysteine hydrolase [Mycobacterium basiliense]VDM89064.1 Peroxyureidoacrylate/ureidoacrylate amidohydrolase RutB [Mycobacterium basiliense]
MPVIDARPFPYQFDINHSALVCIDMQRDFCMPGGFADSLGNDVKNVAPCIPVIRELQDAFRRIGVPVIHTKECHKPDLSDLPTAKLNRGNPKLKIGSVGPLGRILIDGEGGSDFIAENVPLKDELVIPKPGKDAFYRTVFHDYLMTRNISNLVITGITTEVCVQTTMRCANDRGYDCLLIEDATDSYFPEFKEMTLRSLVAQGGIVGWTCTSDKLLDALASI